jgi:hypothetical protein
LLQPFATFTNTISREKYPSFVQAMPVLTLASPSTGFL